MNQKTSLIITDSMIQCNNNNNKNPKKFQQQTQAMTIIDYIEKKNDRTLTRSTYCCYFPLFRLHQPGDS